MKYLAIKRKENGNIYISASFFNRFNESDLPKYGFTKVEVPNDYVDINTQDFNDDLTFNVEKYNQRKQKELNEIRLVEIKKRMRELTEDFIQVQAGAVIENIEEKYIEFRTLHNEAREIEGKEPRVYN